MKRLLWVAIVIGMLGCVTQSQATPAFYSCTVTATGQGWGNPYIYVSLTDVGGTFTNRWWISPSDSTQANRMLAVGLTAINSGTTVLVWVDPAMEYSQIGALYLTNQ